MIKKMYTEPTMEIVSLKTAEIMQMADPSDKGGPSAPAREPDLDLF